MTSARELYEELLALSITEEAARLRSIAVDALVVSLYERLLERPHESIDDARAAVAEGADEISDGPGETLRVNNVHLSWRAVHDVWRWPPENFAPYDVMLARKLPGVRVIGRGWGMSTLAHPKRGGGLLIAVDPESALPSPVAWAVEGERVRCVLGATWEHVTTFLTGHGDHTCLANLPGFAKLSVAGSIGMGGHGSSVTLGPLASMVESVRIGHDDAHAVGIDRADPRFDYAITHLGRLGPVLGVELRVQPRYQIRETRDLHVLGRSKGWEAELHELVAHAVTLHDSTEEDVHSTEIWIAPYVDDGELVTVLGKRVRTPEAPGHGARPAVLRSQALQLLGQLAVRLVSSTDPRWIRRVLRRTVKATVSGPVVMRAAEGLDFGAPNENPMGAIEMAMDISDRVDARALVTAIQTLEELAQTGRYVFAPIGVRFVGPGPAHGLSPHQGRRRTMHIEVPTFASEPVFHGDEVLAPVQRALAALGARPHWGQRIYLTPPELRALWPEEERLAMRRLVAELEPAGVFANELLDAVLEIT
ncbi:MAG: hypothetical protein JST00_15480 [Deltaproteobacteria bacterium]|nr:hypothetical protein [Deltaproteobacteria bacterium]